MPYSEKAAMIQKGMLLTAPGGRCESPRIQRGALMIKDGGPVIAPDHPVRYGDALPDVSALRARQAEMQRRLEALLEDRKNARG